MQNEIQIMMSGFDDGRTPHVQQYDVASRVYICRLWERQGVPYQMANDAIVGAVFKWRRSTGSHEYETEMLDSSTVKVTVPAEAMQLAGRVEMQLAIHQNGGLLHSPVIGFMAMKSLKASDKETDEPAMLLVALVDQTQKGLSAMEEATKALDGMQVRAVPSDILSVNMTTENGVKVITFGLMAGKHPYIAENGNWYVYDLEQNRYVDSGMYSGGQAPAIGENGNWLIGGEDTGVAAVGQPGKDGEDGQDGADGTTPQRGVDYWTTADIAEIQAYIDQHMPAATVVVNDLTTGGTTSALSAEMGKQLENTKMAKTDVVNDLTTGGASKALSAQQGVELDGRIKAYEEAVTITDDGIDLNGKYIDNALFR